MSVAKTSVQVAVAEGTTIELIGLLTQFITKYRCNTGLNINEIQEVIPQRQPLELHNDNIPEISNPEYHKPKGRPPKRYKAPTEDIKQNISSSSKTCSNCLEKGHNIRSCTKNKVDSERV
jgi:hypothetical protein